jgi:hypothetical protein
MRRLLYCLPLCLLLAPNGIEPAAPQPGATYTTPHPTNADAALPSKAELERLAENDPVAFLETCLRRTQREVSTYRVVMHKQERIEGKLQPPEEVELFVREQPYSVVMRWLQGERKARSVMYVEGANNGKLLALPSGFLGRVSGVVSREVDGAEARQSGRYTILEAGLQQGLWRTVRDWTARAKVTSLQVAYQGIKTVPEVDGRECYVLRRTCARPELDGITEVILYIDTATWLQLGAVVRGPVGLIGEYYYRGLRLNIELPPDQFTPAALSR